MAVTVIRLSFLADRMTAATVGLIGHGRIGTYLTERIGTAPDIEIGFVHTRTDPVDDLGRAAATADIVVEAADFRTVREVGPTVVAHSNLVVLSGTALADAEFAATLREGCRQHDTTIYVPHGALLGMDGLQDARESFDSVHIETRKNPENLDFSFTDQHAAADIDAETVLYEGPTRTVCELFPRNVNSHATVALAGLGFEDTSSTLTADPTASAATHHITATGDGTTLEITRRSDITGVTGAYTLVSIWGTVQRILTPEPGVAIV